MERSLTKVNPSFYPILLTYFLDTFGLGIIYPVFSPLFLNPDFGLFTADVSMDMRSKLFYLFICTFAVAQLCSLSLIGQFADRFGRKKVFYFTLMGSAIGNALIAISLQYNNIPLLFFGRFWCGVFAGNLAICLAAMSDISTVAISRVKNFSLIASVGGLSFILSLLTGNLLVLGLGGTLFIPSRPFWILAFVALLNLWLMTEFYQETHPRDPKRGLALKRGIQSIIHVIKNPILSRLYPIYFFFMMCWLTNIQFFPKHLQVAFKSSPLFISFCFLGLGFLWSLSNWLISRFYPHGYPPPKVLAYSLLFFTVLLFVLQFAANLPFFLTIIASTVLFGALTWTLIITTLSLSASHEIQGKLFGINQSLGALAAIAGPTIASFTESYNFHLLYLFTGISSLIAFLYILSIEKKLLKQ